MADMYSDKKPSKAPRLLLAAVVLAVLVLVCVLVSSAGGSAAKESGAAAIREAVEQSARQCYAVEGVYPPSLQYLCDNYGLQVNTEDYYIRYTAYASNLPPEVRVTAKHP